MIASNYDLRHSAAFEMLHTIRKFLNDYNNSKHGQNVHYPEERG